MPRLVRRPHFSFELRTVRSIPFQLRTSGSMRSTIVLTPLVVNCVFTCPKEVIGAVILTVVYNCYMD